MESTSKIPLRYHTSEKMFYEEDGTLAEEPEESLEELEKNYTDACAAMKKYREQYEEVMRPYRNPETGEIDYDALDNDNSEQGLNAFQFALAGFNGDNALDEYQYLIDLKIMHINARNN